MDEKTVVALLTGGGTLAVSAVLQKLLEPYTRRRADEQAQAKLFLEREAQQLTEARRLRDEQAAMTDRERKRADEAEERCESVGQERDHWKEEANRIRTEFVDFRAGCVGKGRPCNQEAPLIQLHPYAPPPGPPSAPENTDKP